MKNTLKTTFVPIEMQIREAKESDRKMIRQMLDAVNLPTESVEKATTTFYLAARDGNVVGIAGFEFYGKDALLRSVAVPPQLQKQGIGEQIVDFMISTARERHINHLVLLTETAQKFFERKGFAVIDRSTIDNVAMKQSTEFTIACPTSAVCMKLDL